MLQGNPDLEPETVTTFDAQYFYYTKNLQWALTYFHSKQNNLITRINAGPATYTNANELELSGVELEWKWLPYEVSKFFVTGSITHQENTLSDDIGKFSDGFDDVDDFTHAPNDMAKLGVIYHFNPAVILGVFNTYMSEPSDVAEVNPAREVVNGKPKSFNFLTAKLSVDIPRLFGIDESMKFEVYGYNLLDEEINYPESIRRQINSLPGRSGRAFYFSIRMEY